MTQLLNRPLHLTLLFLTIGLIGLTGCASSPYSLDDVGNIATLGMWGGIHRPGIPDPHWPVANTAPEDLKAGVRALEWGGVARTDSAIKHLQQAVADHPCDATAHFYLGLAYAYGEAKTREDWDRAMERQSASLAKPPIEALGRAFPEATAQFYNQLYEHQMGATLQPLRQAQEALLARAVALRRGEVAQCKR